MTSDLPPLINNVKKRIADNEVAVSMIVRLVHSVEIAPIAKACGFDSIYIDLEHCTFSLQTTSQICIASLLSGITPFVRVPSLDADWISRVLDGGALGVIAPHVRNRADAEKVVKSSKFAPSGDRSVTVGIPHLGFGDYPAKQSRQIMNDATSVVVMIESSEGLDHVDEIAAVDGVDILMVGTNDLTSELGIDRQFNHPLVKSAYQKVIDAARKHGKTVGIGGLAGQPDLLKQFIDMGARYVSSGADLGFLMAGAKGRAEAIRAYKAS